MTEKLKVAVVGVGYMGQYHAMCEAQAENVELVAVVDPNEAVGKPFAEELGVKYIKNVEDLKDYPEIQAVNICVPEEYHLASAEVCAKLGKHIEIEKPIAKTYEDAMKIKKVCEENNVRLMVEHTVHFVPDYQIMKSEYENSVGNLSQVTITRHLIREDMDRFKGRVSILYYVAVHDLEAVQWISGHKITKVFARRVDTMKAFGEEGFSILFEMDNGACGTMNVGWQLPMASGASMDRIVFVGDKGCIDYDQSRNPLRKYDENGYGDILPAFWPVFGKLTGPYLAEDTHFADAVLNNKEFLMDTDDAIYILKVLEAALRSAETEKFETVE